MGFKVGIKDILIAGGPTLALLLALSVYSIGLIWERWRFHRRALAGMESFLDKVRAVVKSGNLSDAVTACKSHKGPAASVVMATLVGPTSRDERKRSAQRAIERAATQLTARVNTLGTIASTAPFIGLLGTVIGVMHAFRDLASAAGAGPGVVAIGISEALICTAAGLVVAIPAVPAYNYFSASAARFAEELNWLSDEILEALAEGSKK